MNGLLPDDVPMAVPTQAHGYSIEHFGPARWPVALQALLRCFPGTAAPWWQAGFERTRAVPCNAPEQPLGMLMHGPRGVAGVVLVFSSRRPAHAGVPPTLHVSLSSGAIAPDAREHVMWCTRHVAHDPAAVYTALTPIPSMVRVLQRLRFQAISHQLVVSVTPRLALAAAGGERVLDAAETMSALKDHPMLGALQDHHRLGCLVCAVETSKGLMPLVFRRRWRSFRVPVAELIYAESTAEFAKVVAPLSRFLLRRGYPLLEFEADEDLAIGFPATKLFRRRFATGPYPRRGIDHLYSELVYLHR